MRPEIVPREAPSAEVGVLDGGVRHLPEERLEHAAPARATQIDRIGFQLALVGASLPLAIGPSELLEGSALELAGVLAVACVVACARTWRQVPHRIPPSLPAGLPVEREAPDRLVRLAQGAAAGLVVGLVARLAGAADDAVLLGVAVLLGEVVTYGRVALWERRHGAELIWARDDEGRDLPRLSA